MLNRAQAQDAPAAGWFLAALIAFGIGTLCWEWGLFTPLDRAAFDLETRWLEHTIESDVVIVEMDARSLHELGAWPWRRSRHAELIARLQRLGARRLFVDIDFSAPAPFAEDDARLALELARAQGTIVIPAFWQPLSSNGDALILSEPLPALRRNPYVHSGAVNLVPGPDGLVRDVADLTSLSSEAIPPVWRRLVPVDGHAAADALPLDFRIAPTSFSHLSYVDVLKGILTPNLSGKTVFIGATALELGDNVPVPIYGSLPGVVVQAIAYESGRHRSTTPIGRALYLTILLLWVITCTLLLTRLSWKRAFLAAPALLAVPLLSSALLYAGLDLYSPPWAFVAAALACIAASLLRSLNLETLRSWRASLRVRHQDALLRQISNTSHDGLLTMDAHGSVRDANQTAAVMLGVPLTALIGQPLRLTAPYLQADLDRLSEETPFLSRGLELALPDAPALPIEVVMTRLPWEESFVIAISIRDVSAQQKREQELYYHATHDALTHLGNRRLMMERLHVALQKHTALEPFAVLMLDLDGFKQVNDIFGHGVGDDLLIEIGRRLKVLAIRCECVARIGGDEFSILLSDEQTKSLSDICHEVQSLIQEPVTICGVPISLGASIGVSLYPEHGGEAEILLQRADIALYSAKRRHSPTEIYSSSLDFSSPRRLQMLNELKGAVAQEQFTLHFQPKVLMRSGAAVEVEALCRWHSPVFGNVSPSEFIPLIEASELVRPVTQWTIRQSLASCRQWRSNGVHLKVAVNLSARLLQDDELSSWLEKLLHTTGSEADWLELEITESAIMADTERALKTLRALSELGITLSIDDFGTGYSSLAYLQKLSVNRLKIDKSFVDGLGHSESDKLIVKSTIDLAHGLGLDVVAEGIETQAQYGALQTMGCDYGQGYLIARPMSGNLLLKWYLSRSSDGGAVPWHTPSTMVSSDYT